MSGIIGMLRMPGKTGMPVITGMPGMYVLL